VSKILLCGDELERISGNIETGGVCEIFRRLINDQKCLQEYLRCKVFNLFDPSTWFSTYNQPALPCAGFCNRRGVS